MITCAGCGFENDERSRFCGSCGAPMAGHFTPGHVLQGRFRIDSVIESGPGSWVYLGYDIHGKVPVRVRQIKPPDRNSLSSPSITARKSRQLYSISSGKVAGLIDVIFDDDSVFLIYRHVNGITLDRLPPAKREDPEFVKQVMKWLREALDIIDLLHSGADPLPVGTLRPSSFTVMSANQLILAETGFSFVLRRREDLARFVRPGFAPPELFTLGKVIPASDIFSVGVIFYSLLTGINPEERQGDLFHLNRAGQFNRSVGSALETLIMSMVREDYRSRARGAGSLRKKIERVMRPDSPAQKHITRGIAAYNQGKFELAAGEFKSAGLLDPEDATAFFWRGMTCAATNDTDGAMLYFDRALNLDPDYQSAYYQRGAVLMRREEYASAIRDFTGAILRDRDDSRAYLGRAMAFNNLGQVNSAMDDLDQAVELDPDFAKAHLWLGLLSFEQGQVEPALEEYDRALDADPEDPFAYLCRGIARSEAGDAQGALSDMDTALELHPSYGNAYLERGILLDRMGEPELSVADLNRSVELDRGNPDGYFHRGKVRYKLKDYNGVIRDMTYFISRVPDVDEAYRMRGQAYKCMGHFDEGNRDAERYRQMRKSAQEE